MLKEPTRAGVCVCGNVAEIVNNQRVPLNWITLGMQQYDSVRWKNMYCTTECLDSDLTNIYKWMKLLVITS